MEKVFVLLLILRLASGAVVQSPTQATIQNAQSLLVPFSAKSIDSIFLKFPSQADLETIFYSADTLALVRLIQTIEVKREQIPCDALAVYSDQVIGMIKVVLAKKTLTSDQLSVIIESAEKEIARINIQVDKLKSQQDSLNLASIQSNLTSLVFILQSQYYAYNQEKKKIDPLQAQITGYQTQNQILMNNSNSDRSLITQRKLEVVQHQASIKELQQKLQQVQNRRELALSEIKNATERVASVQNKTTQNSQKILELRSQIDSSNKKSDELQLSYSKLETQVERLRSDLAIAQAKQNQIALGLQDFNDKLVVQRNRLVYRELNTTKTMVSTLTNILPNFQAQNLQIYSTCFGMNSTQTFQTGSVLVYLVQGLSAYTTGLYNSNMGNVNNNARLGVVDVFGKSWTSSYGAAFNSTQMPQDSSVLEGDFTCLNPSQVQSGKGTISKIQNNVIEARSSSGQTWSIRVGACSRIQSTEVVPKVGQRIIFKGIFRPQSSTVSLYAATCI